MDYEPCRKEMRSKSLAKSPVLPTRRFMARIRSVDSPTGCQPKSVLLAAGAGPGASGRLLERSEDSLEITRLRLDEFTGLESEKSGSGSGSRKSSVVSISEISHTISPRSPAETQKKVSRNGSVPGIDPGPRTLDPVHSGSRTQDPMHSGSRILEPIHSGDFQIEIDQCKIVIDSLVFDIGQTLQNLPPRSAKKDQKFRDELKLELLTEAQKFAAAGKEFVRSATETDPNVFCLKIRGSLEASECLFNSGMNLLRATETLFHAQILGAKIREVLLALKGSLEVSSESFGKGNSNPAAKRLMRQSTSLAATLTALIQTVREL